MPTRAPMMPVFVVVPATLLSCLASCPPTSRARRTATNPAGCSTTPVSPVAEPRPGMLPVRSALLLYTGVPATRGVPNPPITAMAPVARKSLTCMRRSAGVEGSKMPPSWRGSLRLAEAVEDNPCTSSGM